MKKLSLLATPIAALGLAVLSSPQAVFAAEYTLNQTNVDSAIAAAGGGAVNGIDCTNGLGGGACSLAAGDWTLGSNVDMTSANYALNLTENVNLTGSAEYTLTSTIEVTSGTTTLEDLNVNGSLVAINDGTLNVKSGNYSTPEDANGSVLNVYNGGTANITGGTFAAHADSPAVSVGSIENSSTTTINISGGTFIGPFAGIDFVNEPQYAEGPVSANISGGTFNGGRAGMSIVFPSLNNIVLSGGTFTGGEYAIVVWNPDATASDVNALLASGYSYTNSNVETSDTAIFIAGTTSVVGGSSSADDEPVKGSGLGAPNSGVATAEKSSATASNLYSALATASAMAVAIFGALRIRRAHRKA